MDNADMGLSLDPNEGRAPSPVQLTGEDVAPLPEQQRPAPGLASAPAPKPEAEKPVYRSDNPMTAALSFFRDPARLKLAAMAAAEAQRPDLLDWIKRGYEAQKENGIDAIGALAVGDKTKALQLFNAGGDEQVESIEEGPSKGLFTVVNKDGVRRDIDPKKELYRFLTPPQQYKAQHDEEVLDLKRENANTVAQLRREAQDLKSSHQKEMIEIQLKRLELARDGEERKAQADAIRAMLTQAQVGLVTAQTGLAAARAGNIGADKPFNTKDFQAAVKKEVDGLYTGTDDMGKKAFNAEEALIVKTLANKKRAPGVDPADAAQEARDEWEAAKTTVTTDIKAKVDEARKNAGWFGGDAAVKKVTGGLPVDEYIKKETVKRARAGLSGTDPTPRAAGTAQVADGGSAKVAPGTGTEAVGIPGTNPPDVPKSPHKEGTPLMKKGKRYTVVNGLPQLDPGQ